MARLTARSRSLFVLLCLALCVCELVGARQVRSNVLAERQILSLPGDDTTTGGGTATTGNTATNTNTQTTNTNTATTTTQPQTTTSTQPAETTQPGTTPGTTTTEPTQTTGPTDTNTQTQTQNTDTTQTPPQPTDTVLSTTDANGSPVFVTTFVTPSETESSSASASASQTADRSDNDSGIGTGSIIAMAVAGGVAVIGVVAFFIWKFTRKRYADFDDEPIKWPELNSHANDNLNYALPTDRATTGAGAGLDSASEVNLGRNASVAAYSAYSQPSQYTHPSAGDSTADLYAPGGDPYAVPPLPHLNPNQPYRDDPGLGAAAYYDPYRGPVPQTFNDGASIHSVGPHGGEAIPMSNLAQAGRRSPGPQMGLDMGRTVSPQPPMAGRQSPGPTIAYAPGAGPAMSGRHSPGPAVAYGGGY